MQSDRSSGQFFGCQQYYFLQSYANKVWVKSLERDFEKYLRLLYPVIIWQIFIYDLFLVLDSVSTQKYSHWERGIREIGEACRFLSPSSIPWSYINWFVSLPPYFYSVKQRWK